MRAWEEREIERQKAFAEGEEAGIDTGKTQGKNDLLKSQKMSQPVKQLLTNYNS